MSSKRINIAQLTKNTAYQHVRLKLLSENMLGKEQQSKVIGLLSRVTGEGVTTTAAGLALVVHSRTPGSVLLIDANPTDFRLADLLQCESKAVSSKNFNEASFNINDYIVRSDDTGLPLLTLTKIANSFTCSDAQFSAFLNELKVRFESIIVDMGAWNTEAPLCWIEQVDDLILVLDGNCTSQEMLTHFKKTIDRCGCKLSGFIMNKQQRPIPDFVYRMIT